MSRSAEPAQSRRDRVLEAIADLAAEHGGNGMRITEAARILTLAREIERLVSSGPVGAGDAIDPSSAMVADIIRPWNPALVTAREYAEMLPPMVIDRLLRAAPIWAEQVATPVPRRAA